MYTIQYTVYTINVYYTVYSIHYKCTVSDRGYSKR